MKKFAFLLSTLILSTGSQLVAAPTNTNGATTPPPTGGTNQPRQLMQSPNCTQLTQAEQNFAAQIIDVGNRTMFCNQFTLQQRQQAMQLMGQPDSSGNIMNADQAVQQVTSASMTSPTPPKSKGGCPVQ